MKMLIIYPLLVLFLSSACGSTKEAKAPDSSVQNTPAMSTQNQAQDFDTPLQAANYRLIISFISIGEGTDPQAREMMDKVLNSWKEKKGKVIEMETTPWGREGEVDFCFMLSELGEKEQTAFADEMKTVFKDKSLVQISENQPCSHKN